MTTRKLGFTALAKAVYSRLTTHANTSSYSFYSFTPKETSMPYHVITGLVGTRSLDFTTRDTEAEDNVVEIHSWFDETSGLGPKACADAMNNIAQAITSSALSIQAYYAPYITRLTFCEIVEDHTDPTERVFHGILRFRFEMAPS